MMSQSVCSAGGRAWSFRAILGEDPPLSCFIGDVRVSCCHLVHVVVIAGAANSLPLISRLISIGRRGKARRTCRGSKVCCADQRTKEMHAFKR